MAASRMLPLISGNLLILLRKLEEQRRYDDDPHFDAIKIPIK